jgi:hypothetical protein
MESEILTPSNCLIIICALFVVSILLYLAVRKEQIVFTPISTSYPQTQTNTPKDELIQYFAQNFPRLAPIFIKDNCDDEYVPPELMNEFKIKFGNYFKNKSEDKDPILKHYIHNTYERNFKMEINEICKTLNSLGKFINSPKYPALQLKDLAKEIDRLHSEHFPQAVFISVILDRMMQICNTYPEYSTDQIVNTHDLLTISIIFYLTKPTNTQ